MGRRSWGRCSRKVEVVRVKGVAAAVAADGRTPTTFRRSSSSFGVDEAWQPAPNAGLPKASGPVLLRRAKTLFLQGSLLLVPTSSTFFAQTAALHTELSPKRVRASHPVAGSALRRHPQAKTLRANHPAGVPRRPAPDPCERRWRGRGSVRSDGTRRRRPQTPFPRPIRLPHH